MGQYFKAFLGFFGLGILLVFLFMVIPRHIDYYQWHTKNVESLEQDKALWELYQERKRVHTYTLYQLKELEETISVKKELVARQEQMLLKNWIFLSVVVVLVLICLKAYTYYTNIPFKRFYHM